MNDIDDQREVSARWATALVVLLVLVAAACGSAESGIQAASQPEAPQSVTPEPTPEETTAPATLASAASEPSNDLLMDAVIIDPTALPFMVQVDTLGATSDDDDLDAGCPAPAIEGSVWYAITPTSDVALAIDTDGTDYPTGITAASGQPGALELVSCMPGELIVETQANVTYYFQVFDDRPDATEHGGNLVLSIAEAADADVQGGDLGDILADSDASRITIDSIVDFSGEEAIGTFALTQGAEALGCSSGVFVDTDNPPLGIERRHTCEDGSRTGTFTIRFIPVPDGPPWQIIETTGDFEGLAGTGQFMLVDLDEENMEATTSFTGIVSLGGTFAEPAETFPRLVARGGSECAADGLVTIDGLREFAVVGSELRRMDLVTQQVTTHGAAPIECSTYWLGDETFGRRVAGSFEGDRVWFGPFDGPFDTEMRFDSPRLLLSRSFAGNRLVFQEPEKSRVVIVDATTGEAVGDPIAGGFDGGRDFVAIATSDDQAVIAIGGANPGGANGDGQIFMVDAESGAVLYQLDTMSPVTSMVFDDTTEQLIAASFTGRLLTIDLATQTIVHEVDNTSGATIDAIGIRADGLIVAHTDRDIELLDRSAGPIGEPLLLLNSGAARIRPDGSVNSLTRDGFFEVFVIDG